MLFPPWVIARKSNLMRTGVFACIYALLDSAEKETVQNTCASLTADTLIREARCAETDGDRAVAQFTFKALSERFLDALPPTVKTCFLRIRRSWQLAKGIAWEETLKALPSCSPNRLGRGLEGVVSGR